MLRRLLALAACLLPAAVAALVQDVRSAINAGDFQRAEALIEHHRTSQGRTPEMLVAYSLLARGALAASRYDAAEKYAADTKKLSLDAMKGRDVDAEPQLPLALGASIEVLAQVSAARGERDQAVHFLKNELQAYRETSLRARIQKNINLLSLEGKRAPALEGVPRSTYLGRPVLMFFWAHWCSDCKAAEPVLEKIQQEFRNNEILLIAPTQTYGYAERGREVPAAEEIRYITDVRKHFYPSLEKVQVPISSENFKVYGSSTTPTLVLLDRRGIVRLYHPGVMSFAELQPKIKQLVSER